MAKIEKFDQVDFDKKKLFKTDTIYFLVYICKCT